MKIVPVIFSKNRAMQLRAQLESMKFYTGFSDMIYIITPTVELYEDIGKDFTNVYFIDEKVDHGFHMAFDRLIAQFADDDIILLSVDDFVYTNYFNLANARVLNNKSLTNVVGLTLRMGRNTVPYDESWNVSGSLPFVIYDWRGKPSHLGYPFDVSASFYKASLIKEIIANTKRPINIPNDLESFGVQYIYNSKSDSLPYYMMNNGLSIGCCADLNRVQDLYQNKTQGGEECTAENMNEMYKQGKRINWSNYYMIAPPEPFIGKERMVIV